MLFEVLLCDIIEREGFHVDGASVRGNSVKRLLVSVRKKWTKHLRLNSKDLET